MKYFGLNHGLEDPDYDIKGDILRKFCCFLEYIKEVFHKNTKKIIFMAKKSSKIAFQSLR